MSFTSAALKQKILEVWTTDPAAKKTIEDRHGGHFPKGYSNIKYWSRFKKVKLNSKEEQDDKLGFEPCTDEWAADYRKVLEPITFPCIARIFVCMLGEKDIDYDLEDKLEEQGLPSDCPDDTTFLIITDANDEKILMYQFSSD